MSAAYITIGQTALPGAWEWAFLLLIGLVLFVLPMSVLLIALLAYSRTARRVFLNLGAGALIVMIVVIILIAFMSRATSPVYVAQSSVTVESTVGPHVSASITERNGRTLLSQPYTRVHQERSDRELPFEPDVYASQASAVRGAARSVARQYEQRITSADQRPRTVRANGRPGVNGRMHDEARTARSGSSGQLMADAADEVARVLGATHLEVPTSLAAMATQPAQSTDPQAVELTIEVVHAMATDIDAALQGVLRATLAGPRGSFSGEAAFVDKRWSEDFESWRVQQDRTDWVKGLSDSLCVTVDEARAQAMADAARQVVDVVIAHGESRYKDTFAVHTRRDSLSSWLGEVVPRWLEMGQLQSDSFVQTYDRPYGTLYSCAMRVHVTPEKADTLLDAYFSYDRGLRASWVQAILSAVGLLVLIGVVYLFLDSATRGYYVWSVRIAAVMMAAVGVWCVRMLT